MWNVIEDDIKDFKEIILNKIFAINSNLKMEIVDSLIKENSYIDFVIDAIQKL